MCESTAYMGSDLLLSDMVGMIASCHTSYFVLVCTSNIAYRVQSNLLSPMIHITIFSSNEQSVSYSKIGC